MLAQVAGSDDYRTVLTGSGNKIGGECSCPAFTDWGFCKHMVATALAANKALADGADDGEIDGVGTLGRIRSHLKAKSVDVLVDMIVDLAEHDAELFRKLDLAATTVQGDGKTIEARLRRVIDGATRTGTFVDYGAAASWADGVGMALDAVAELATGEHANVALKLAEHAIDRVEQAIESMDDSDGYCGALLEQARDIHLAACRTVGPIRSRWPGTFLIARWTASTTPSTAQPQSTTRCSARWAWQSIVALPAKPGRSCHPARRTRNCPTTVRGSKACSISSPSAKAMSRSGLRFAPETSIRRGTICGWQSSVSSTVARARHWDTPRKAFGSSRTAGPTKD